MRGSARACFGPTHPLPFISDGFADVQTLLRRLVEGQNRHGVRRGPRTQSTGSAQIRLQILDPPRIWICIHLSQASEKTISSSTSGRSTEAGPP